ncbi:hypothetical protein EV207_10594 [Scopulibacillus darangshiensis]|uniref:Xaa-Pro dipeptidyl-peptidase C-terminal domain-containing protein n=1 Tax=Scopulibacillus darangshiensis TaxID=442528 RepID=A0A4R2P9L9_9BACL|nr:CocE/NonD family hydrolase [Scopulibacillus darangshiensis]TCP30565.1 hypothetical protein EV207_10594 [Scopulibacillus darangshiensis]
MIHDEMILEKNIACKMRDGTMLYSDIYRPNRAGQFPVLLTRLPYNKNLPFYSHRYLDTNRLVSHGYVVIIQDVRGRYRSEGDFQPFMNEAEDGYDTVEWAASLPYSSGKVGMFGLSYYGFTQLMAATERPPHLHAIFPAMTLNDQRDAVLYQNGAYALASSETWALESIAPDQLLRKNNDKTSCNKAMEKWSEYLNGIGELYQHFPVNEWPPLRELGVADFFYEFLERPLEEEGFWQASSIKHKYDRINVPAYHVGGWYDSLLGPTIRNYIDMKGKADGDLAKANQKLIIGPWAHGDFGSVIGERSFGVHASEDWIDGKEDLTSLHLRWFDHWLKGMDAGNFEDAPVKIFVMGINKWRDEAEWPLCRTRYTPFYFHGGGRANTKHGDGRLSMEEPGDERADHFVYDPNKPVPTNGGGTLYAGVNTTGPRDQSHVEKREDVLVFTSEILKQPVEVTGPIKVVLWAKTDAKDTDFTAKLVDVLPDGTAFNLADGIVRAKYRHGNSRETELEEGIVKYDIDLWATSNVFLPGHCIRVEISSSNAPRFLPNPNTGSSLINSSEVLMANQTIHHCENYPSHILLPIIPDVHRA